MYVYNMQFITKKPKAEGRENGMEGTVSTGSMFKYSKHIGDAEYLDSSMTSCRL